MNRNFLIGFGVFAAVVVAGFFLVRKPTPTPSAQTTLTPNLTSIPVESGSAREITIIGNEYSYNPASISVKKGEKVKLTFVNAGTTMHNLVIDKLNVTTKMVAPGKSDSIEFTATDEEILTFYCSVGNHQSLGMEGKLEIK